MIVLVVASRSNALAVMPTVVPTVTFSSTWLLAASVSVGVVTLNSSKSLMVILNVCEATSRRWTGLARSPIAMSPLFHG